MAVIDNGWKFDPVVNKTVGGQVQHLGLIVHIMDGSFAGTKAWFNNPAAQASSHFGTNRDGYAEQWVDTDDKAWAQMAGNKDYISVENEGHGGDELTDGQITRIAEILAWVHKVYGVPLQLANVPGDRGLGWHGMGGAAWGGHYDCPGDHVRAQFPEILKRAAAIVNPSPAPTPNHPYPGYVIKIGAVGTVVKVIQGKVGAVTDGQFGPKTDAAVRAWQRAHGLEDDGEVGKLTWASFWK